MADEESSSVQTVISDDDLLTEILVRLPALSLSLVFFKSVSKRCLSFIKQANLTFRRKPDPPSGLFIHKYTSYNKDKGSCTYDFVPLDIRIPLLATYNFTFGPEVQNESRAAVIFDSCNGLLLCRTLSGKLLYVYNPSITNMFKVLPEPDNVTRYSVNVYGGLKMAFDPTKSSHYKVIYAECLVHDHHASNGIRIQIHTFSSETGKWILCKHRFFQDCFFGFEFGVYWNDAIYWATTGGQVFKLDIMNENPILTALPTPPSTIYWLGPTYKLFESRGCLLLVAAHLFLARHCTIYEKRNVYSEWSVKYTVNLDDIAERCSHERIFCIVLGEREEDSFLVWLLGRKVVKHKIVSKTLSTISDLGPNDNLLGCFQFIPSFVNV